jgi:hypothetical protein
MSRSGRRTSRKWIVLGGGLLLAACAVHPRHPPTTVIVEPAVFVGTVEVVRDPALGSGVWFASATERVVVFDDVMGRILRQCEGDVAMIRGRRIDRTRGRRIDRTLSPPGFLVRELRCLGADAPDAVPHRRRTRATL